VAGKYFYSMWSGSFRSDSTKLGNTLNWMEVDGTEFNFTPGICIESCHYKLLTLCIM
jgi:hypothetical protein